MIHVHTGSGVYHYTYEVVTGSLMIVAFVSEHKRMHLGRAFGA